MILIDFYTNTQTDNYNRFLNEILNFDKVQLENTHNYIQWLFPNYQRSQFYPESPILKTNIINAFVNNNQCKENLLKAFNLMLNFYGFVKKGNKIILAEDFELKKSIWLTVGNHNFLRLTRILKSMNSLGFKNEATELQKLLKEIYLTYPNIIGKKTAEFWEKAL